MLTISMLISTLLVWSVYQHAADGRYVDADDFTGLAAEVAAIKTERQELNNRITALETKLSDGEAKLEAVEATLSITDSKLAETEQKLRVVETKLDDALLHIDKLEQKSSKCKDEEKVASNRIKRHKDREEHMEGENKETSPTRTQTRRGIRERAADGLGQSISTASQRIAFSVYLNHNLAALGAGHPIKFDGVRINEGSAFDVTLSEFVCPVSGVYMFQSALEATIHDYIRTEIVKDGAVLVIMYAAGSTTSHGYDQGFNSVITTCDQGERVWVRENGGTAVFGALYSSFSGYLLWEN